MADSGVMDDAATPCALQRLLPAQSTAYYQELVRYLTRSVGDRQVAADITHDAYVRLLEQGGASVRQPRAFLYRTAINLSIDLHRRNARRRGEQLETLDEEGLADDDPQHRAAHRQQQLRYLQQALDELPEQCKRVFLLRKVEGLSHDEIRRRERISQAMVEKHIVNAMKHCRLRMLQLD